MSYFFCIDSLKILLIDITKVARVIMLPRTHAFLMCLFALIAILSIYFSNPPAKTIAHNYYSSNCVESRRLNHYTKTGNPHLVGLTECVESSLIEPYLLASNPPIPHAFPQSGTVATLFLPQIPMASDFPGYPQGNINILCVLDNC